VWLGASSTQPPTLFYAEKLGHDASAVNTPALMPANWPKVPSQLVQRKNEGPSMEGLLQLPPQAASQKIPLIAVETHCAFSLLGRVSGRWLSRWPAPGISSWARSFRPQNIAYLKCERTRQSSFCTHVCAADLWRTVSRRRDGKTNIILPTEGNRQWQLIIF
jgi:hypothetical protein